MSDNTIITFQCRQSSRQPFIKIDPFGCNYLVKFTYNDDAVRMLKIKVPAQNRSWNKDQKAWIIAPESIEDVCQVLENVFGGRVIRPEAIRDIQAQEVTKQIQVEYIGACKDRGQGNMSSYGFVEDSWSIEFPQSVLERFFSGAIQESIGMHQTFYQRLLIAENADEQTIKSAFRRMALHWHPDRCREPNAADMFRSIDEAYKILSDPIKRKKYDAGLYFEYQSQRGKTLYARKSSYGYRPPLRCGVLEVRGIDRAGRFLVSEIIAWRDLVNDQGQTAVSNWPAGAQTFSIIWV